MSPSWEVESFVFYQVLRLHAVGLALNSKMESYASSLVSLHGGSFAVREGVAEAIWLEQAQSTHATGMRGQESSS